MIRYYPTSLDKGAPSPSFVLSMLKRVGPELESTTLYQSEVVFLLIVTTDAYVFDESVFAQIEHIDLPVIIFDYSEHSFNTQFDQLFEAIKKLRVVGWFKRELKASHQITGCPVWPLDFTICRCPDYDSPQSREDFNRRPIDILMVWGYSNLDRVALHGSLMASFEHFLAGPAPALTFEDIEFILARKQTCAMTLLYTPEYRRLPVERLFWLQNQAKVTISLFGNGMKCFRSAEAGYNSVSAHQAPEEAQWSYPWLDQHNCLALENLPGTNRLDLAKAVQKLRYWTVVDHGALYTLYANGVANNQHYVTDVYGRGYLVPRIKQALCAI